MQAHQERVVTEKKELDEKIDKLGCFFDTPIFASLDEAEKERLKKQHHIMQEYSDVLSERIAAFKD